MKRLLVVPLAVLALAGCGGSDDPTLQERDDATTVGDDARMSVQTIYSPKRGVNIECVVVTSSMYKARAVAVSCDWP